MWVLPFSDLFWNYIHFYLFFTHFSFFVQHHRYIWRSAHSTWGLSPKTSTCMMWEPSTVTPSFGSQIPGAGPPGWPCCATWGSTPRSLWLCAPEYFGVSQRHCGYTVAYWLILKLVRRKCIHLQSLVCRSNFKERAMSPGWYFFLHDGILWSLELNVIQSFDLGNGVTKNEGGNTVAIGAGRSQGREVLPDRLQLQWRQNPRHACLFQRSGHGWCPGRQLVSRRIVLQRGHEAAAHRPLRDRRDGARPSLCSPISITFLSKLSFLKHEVVSFCNSYPLPLLPILSLYHAQPPVEPNFFGAMGFSCIAFSVFLWQPAPADLLCLSPRPMLIPRLCPTPSPAGGGGSAMPWLLTSPSSNETPCASPTASTAA